MESVYECVELYTSVLSCFNSFLNTEPKFYRWWIVALSDSWLFPDRVPLTWDWKCYHGLLEKSPKRQEDSYSASAPDFHGNQTELQYWDWGKCWPFFPHPSWSTIPYSLRNTANSVSFLCQCKNWLFYSHKWSSLSSVHIIGYLKIVNGPWSLESASKMKHSLKSVQTDFTLLIHLISHPIWLNTTWKMCKLIL